MAKGEEVASMVSTTPCYTALGRTYGRGSGHDAREGRTASPEFSYISEILKGTGAGPVYPCPSHQQSGTHHPIPSNNLSSILWRCRPGPDVLTIRVLSAPEPTVADLPSVNELLANQLHFNPRGPHGLHPSGPQIMDIIWTDIRSLTMKIQTTRGIDGLIGSSLGKTGRGGSEEEWDMVAMEIQREMLNMLVEEAVLGLNGSGG